MCQYCESDQDKLYQKNLYSELVFSNFGNNKVLIFKQTKYNCPPYANCCKKGKYALSAFRIKFCPECGRDLSGKKGE